MKLRVAGACLGVAFAAGILTTAAAEDHSKPRWIPVQEARVEDLAVGKLLVAHQDLEDPNFAESVVLITEYADQGATGLIINRMSKVPLSKFFPELRAKNASDPVYSGGPVEETLGFGLLRSRSKLEDTKRILTDVHLITDDKLLDKMVASGRDSSSLRMYVGYCGWGPEQLEREVDLGAWYLFPGSADTVFDSDPDTLWSRLIRKTELRIAKVLRSTFPPPLFHLSSPSGLSQSLR